MGNIPKPVGSFANGTSNEASPLKGGKPDAGIDNSSKGQLAPKGAGPGIPPNRARIR